MAKWHCGKVAIKREQSQALPSVCHFDDVRVALSKKEKSATSCVEIADAERLN